MIEFTLPEIPACKQYKSETTSEQDAIMKCIKRETLSAIDENILEEANAFYEKVFPLLKTIDLSSLTLLEAEDLAKYLDKVFNFNLMVFNDLHFEHLFRVSIIKEEFRVKGKVRDPKYLKYPPLQVIQDSGIYNRANSSNKTVFYASFQENVALRETKPQKGQKIILSIWKNKTGKPFNSYPITNSSISNEGVQKATKSFNETKKTNHPLFAKLMDLNLAFLASEFVKDCPITNPNRLEYFFSAYFADKLLSPLREGDPVPNYDFIIYPSVAWQHKHENVAIVPDSVENKLQLIHAIEYEILETEYDWNVDMDHMPVKMKFIREAKWFEKDLIIWEDE